MPRLGQNPAKFAQTVAHPERVTVAVLTFIPSLEGYHRESLEVLKVCLGSILANTELPYDLMVFDNGSCDEAIEYLQGLHRSGEVDTLVLSGKNVGKVGAWNFIFGAAQGEYIAYSDSDAYFFPGWLSKTLEVFEAYPDVGTVTGQPRRGRTVFCENTIRRVQEIPAISVRRGRFMPEVWVRDYLHSLGKLDQLPEDLAREDILLECRGVPAYVMAAHFQFVLRRELIQRFTPFEYERPMGEDVAQLDRAIDGNGYLRLAVAERVVLHLGNTLDPSLLSQLPQEVVKGEVSGPRGRIRGRGWARLFRLRPIKRLLLWIYNWIFDLYFGPRVRK